MLARADLSNSSFTARPEADSLRPQRRASPRVLLVQRRADRQDLAALLHANGCEVMAQDTLDPADILARHIGPALVVYSASNAQDIFDPALASCRKIGGFGIIVIGDAADSLNGIEALEQYADDFLTRPINNRELLARIRAVWRGCTAPQSYKSNYRFAGFLLDTRQYLLRHPDGQTTRINHHTFRLLSALLNSANRSMSRSEIRTAMAGGGVSDRSIDVHVSRLRARLGDRGLSLIRTVQGEGYKLCARVTRC